MTRSGSKGMARIIDKSEPTSYQIRIKKYKRNIGIIISVAVVIIAIIVVYMVNCFVNRYYNTYKVVSTIPRTDSNTVKYESYGNKLLKFSRDGASAINQDGKAVWNGSYEMKNPSADICGKYVAIADIGGKEVYVFNGSDSGTKIEVLLPIVEVEVAKQGVVALVLQDKDSNKISIFDPYDNQKLLVDRQTIAKKDGFPVDISLSNDGSKLVTSYLAVTSGVVESNVTFYNLGEIGENEVDSMVGAQKFGKTMIPKVEFVNNNTVCVFGDDKFTLYSMKQKQKEIFTETFKSDIKSIFYNSKYVGFVMEKTAETEKNEVVVYNLQGKKTFAKLIDFEYDNVRLSKEEIIFSSDLECNIIRLNGKQKLHCTFDKNISYVMPINNYDLYYIIDDANIEKIKVVKE